MYHLAWVAAVNCCSWSQFRLYPFPFNVDYVVRGDSVVGHLDQVSHLILAFKLEDAEHSLLLAVFSVRENHVPLIQVLDLWTCRLAVGINVPARKQGLVVLQ